MIFERIRKLANFTQELGLSENYLALPSPKLALLPKPDLAELTDDLIFQKMVTESEIVAVSRDLFLSQFYSNSVEEAFKALDHYIKTASGNSMLTGSRLMRAVFSKESPALAFSERKTQSEKDEHEGYGHLFAGSMLGIRNPVAHEHQWIDDRDTALECLIFCQHLLRKAKKAKNQA